MTAKVDKRRANRIQDGWAKATDNKKNNKMVNRRDEVVIDFINNIIPQFNNHIDLNPMPECKIIEIRDDISLNLNELINLNNVHEAKVELRNDFVSPTEAADLCKYFLKSLPWQQRENATNDGKKFLEPRKTCWYGEPYAYCKVTMAPNNDWDPKLHDLMKRVQQHLPDRKFNSVMCNLYMDSKNSIDWHADDEKSLGPMPTIASVSFGGTRAFELCRRSELFTDYKSKSKNPYRSRVKDDPPFEGCSLLYRAFLKSGSLLTMSGSVQDHWLHRVPKEYHDQEPRINFTFRYISPASGK